MTRIRCTILANSNSFSHPFGSPGCAEGQVEGAAVTCDEVGSIIKLPMKESGRADESVELHSVPILATVVFRALSKLLASKLHVLLVTESERSSWWLKFVRTARTIYKMGANYDY